MTRIRQTRMEDAAEVLRIYETARKFMRSTGNLRQWSDYYPSMKSLMQDMAEGNSYVVTDDGRIAATFYFCMGEEPTYGRIYEGEWLNDEPYGVIHRAASDGSIKRVMNVILDYCLSEIDNIRIDTHRDNKVMQNALLRYGLQYCGIIYLDNGDERLAYQICNLAKGSR